MNRRLGVLMALRRWSRAGVLTVIATILWAGAATAKQPSQPFLDRFGHVDQLGSTIPSNGDVNPYGVAVVPHSVGDLVKDDVLVSNFNDSLNGPGLPAADPSRPARVGNGGSVGRIQLDRLQRPGGPEVPSEHVIASALAERTDPFALVVGPTGVALANDGTLYLADTVNSRI